MRVNGFNKDRDYIYQDLLRWSCEEYLISATCLVVDDKNYEDMFQPEIIKRRLIRSKYLSLDGQATGTEALMLLLLHRGYITANQIRNLKLFSIKSDSTGVMLNKLLKRGGAYNKAKLKSEIFNPAISNEKVYYLTPATRQQVIENFPERYLEDNMIDTSDLSPVPGTRLQHDVELLNVFYYLLADLNFMHFKWLSNIQLVEWNKDDFSSLQDAVEKTNHGNKNEVLRPDAIIVSEEDDPSQSALAIYIQHDIGKKSESHYKQVLTNYASFFNNRDSTYLACEEIICSLSLKEPGLIQARNMSRKILEIKRIRRFIEKIINDEGTNNYLQIISKLNKMLDDCNKAQQLKFLISSKNLIKAALKNKPDSDVLISILEFEKYCQEKEDVQNKALYKKNCLKKLRKRQELIKSAAESIQEFKQMLLKGYSLHIVDNSRLQNLPYHLIQGYKTYERLIDKLKKKYFNIEFEHTFEPTVTFHNDDKEFVLKNCIKGHPSDIPIIFENISADIGGELRVKSFLAEGKAQDTELFLILLVESEAFAKEFEQSSLSLYSTENEKSNNRNVIYINYDGICDEEKIFTIDCNGNVIYI